MQDGFAVDGAALIHIVAAAAHRLGFVLDLGGDAADLFHGGDGAVLIGDNADRDPHQGKRLQMTLPVGGDQTATAQVVLVVEGAALCVPALRQVDADRVYALGRGDDDEIVAADMADKIGDVPDVTRDLDRDACELPDQGVALEETVDIVECLEVVQVHVQDRPVAGGKELLLDGTLHAQARRQPRERGKEAFFDVPELGADARHELVGVEGLGEVIVRT